MSDRKLWIRFYTIADFAEEEIWLRRQHNNGRKLAKMIAPCFYVFEKCRPEDIIYRLDYKNNAQDNEYMQMVRDFGWEYCGSCLGWLYFRKSAAAADTESDAQLFSDNATRRDMLAHVIKTRLLPSCFVFLCCVIPNALRAMESTFNTWFTAFWLVMLGIYIWLLIHCGRKLYKLKRDLDR